MVRRAATAAKLSLDTLRNMRAGLQYAHRLPAESPGPGLDGQANNPLEAYFDSVTEGPGIWKWRHYFAIYHRHLQRFVGKAPRVLEIGIYSGGSLPMWLHYFGDGTQVYGVDIEPACTRTNAKVCACSSATRPTRSFGSGSCPRYRAWTL